MRPEKRNAMMYKAIKAMYNVDFQKSFFELTWQECNLLADFAELFHITPRYGESPGRTLFYRMADYELGRKGE